MVEQTSAAARNLTSEVQTLAEETHKFKVEGSPSGATAAFRGGASAGHLHARPARLAERMRVAAG
jgi:hypothetical protein